MAKRVQTDKMKKMSDLKIYRLPSDVFRRHLSDWWESSPKRAIGKCGNALSENQTDAWAAKNVIERIEVLRVMAAPFFACENWKQADYRGNVWNVTIKLCFFVNRCCNTVMTQWKQKAACTFKNQSAGCFLRFQTTSIRHRVRYHLVLSKKSIPHNLNRL